MTLWLGAVILTSCQVPERRKWDVGLIVPVSLQPVSVLDLLPGAVDTTTFAGEPAYRLADQQDSLAYRLGEMCEACLPLQGLLAPVPGFDYADSVEVHFPGEIFSFEILQARLGVRFCNELDFDPLRPHPDPDSAGFLAIVLRDLGSGALLDSVLISGAADSIPANSTWQLLLPLTDFELREGFRALFSLHSPEDGQMARTKTF